MGSWWRMITLAYETWLMDFTFLKLAKTDDTP